MATLSLRHPTALGDAHQTFADPLIAAATLVPFGAGLAIAWRAGGVVHFGIAAVASLAVIAIAMLLFRYSHPAVALYAPAVLLGSVLLQRARITPVAVIGAVVLGILMANILLVIKGADGRTSTLVSTLFTIAFALPIVWGVYAGPFRLTAVFFGVPLAIFASNMLDRKQTDVAHAATLLTFVVTGVALMLAELLG